MKTRTRILIASAFLIITSGGLLFWISRQVNTTTPARLTVAASIFPIADIARQVAGNDVRVLQILPAGVSEHHYTPTPQQLVDIQQAKALFVIGQGLDMWASDPISKVTDLPITAVDKGIALREFGEEESEEHAAEPEEGNHEEEHEHAEGSLDPHYWLTVPNAQTIAATIAEELQTLDPEHAEEYRQNLLTYTRELANLEVELQRHAQRAPQPEFIAMHDAWHYLADHYGFHLVATYEPVEGRDPSIADLQRLKEVVEHYNIQAFYSEPQKQSGGATRFLQNDFGLEIRTLDPIGGYAPYDSYVNLMRINIETIAR